jgi:hypothetical protein
VKVRLAAYLLALGAVLSGCSGSTSVAPETEIAQKTQETPSSESAKEFGQPKEIKASEESRITQEEEITDTQGSLLEPEVKTETTLIASIPAEKSINGLKTHFQKIDQAASYLKPITIDYTIGPTAVESNVRLVVDKFAEKLKMFQFLGLKSLNQNWVLVSEKDYKWWVNHRLSQDASFPVEMWNEQINELGHCRLSADVFCGAGNTVKGKNYQDNVVGTGFTNRGLNYVSRHEAAHFYQAVFGYGGRCWMAEGQATFFETYLETSSRSREGVISRLKTSQSGVTKLSQQQLLNLIEKDEVCQKDSDVAYDLGMLGYEYLYQNFSFLDVHNLQVSSSSKGWDKAVSEVLSINAQELNRDLAAYIFKETR